MTVRPIIFSAPMVRALLDGRKTMTRRALKPQPETFVDRDGCTLQVGLLHTEGEPLPRITQGRVITRQQVRFAPGDLLWVRESVRTDEDENFDRCLCYLADDEVRRVVGADDVSSAAFGAWWLLKAYRSNDPDLDGDKVVPPIHMPRWASRITLAVTAVKVERLQDISEADAKAEGVPVSTAEHTFVKCFRDPAERAAERLKRFADLWNSINGPGAWQANPWVVALTFTVHRTNVGTFPTAHSPRPTAEPA